MQSELSENGAMATLEKLTVSTGQTTNVPLA